MAKNNDNRSFEIPRPEFPRRAVITGGMPYGNKELHFGHVGGMLVFADTFARFMRDRIGSENVIFVTGTDCYGSPIAEGWRQKCEKGEFEGSLEDFVRSNHNKRLWINTASRPTFMLLPALTAPRRYTPR